MPRHEQRPRIGRIVRLLSAIILAAAAAVTTLAPAAGSASITYPVYTQAEIDSWSATSSEYTRLASSWAGNVSRSYVSFGAEISTTERDVFRDQSVYIKVQAVLWAADGNAARRSKVVALLTELGKVTSFQADAAEQRRLVAGWAATNLAQAAAIIGHRDTAFTAFLVNVCYPLLDWSNGPNWHASFADSRLAIASYTGDQALWSNATAYFYRRLSQSIYHSAYDGGKVDPLLKSSGSPDVTLTVAHWGGAWGLPQVKSDFTPTNPALFPDGVNAERRRDLGHVSMGLAAWTHGARTILAHGDQLSREAYDRLRAAYAHHAQRVVQHLSTGSIPEPTTAAGNGEGTPVYGWYGACRLFGTDTPASLRTLCDHAKVAAAAPAGANHTVAEAFADR